MLTNDVLGTLMRSKASHVNEGGVSMGLGVIDSPLIVNSDFFSRATDRVNGTIKIAANEVPSYTESH